MRKWTITVCLMLAGIFLACSAMASGVTLRTYTPFAEQDPAEQIYNDLIEAWAVENGNAIEDFSGIQNDQFMDALKEALKDGSADILVIPVGTDIDTSLLVDIDTLFAALPDGGVRKMNGMKEPSGQIILAPVRFNWETLYVNTALLAQYGLEAPATFNDLVIVCFQLSELGVVPIANALCEWSETALDCMALMGSTAAEYGAQASLDGAASVLDSLVMVNSFGSDPWNAEDADMEALFLSGEAAMRFDSSDLALRIPEEVADNYAVIQLPCMTESTALVGYPDCGLAVTKACFDDPARKEAALSLVKTLLTSGIPAMGSGALGDSVATLSNGASEIVGVLYDFSPDTFDTWSENVISAQMGASAQE